MLCFGLERSTAKGPMEFSVHQTAAEKWFTSYVEKTGPKGAYNVGEQYIPNQHMPGLKTQPEDIARSQLWYLRAAESGLGSAMWRLTEFAAGKYGCEPNGEKFVFWCKKAEEAGISKATPYMADCYAYGFHVPVQVNEAVMRWEKTLDSDTISENCRMFARRCLYGYHSPMIWKMPPSRERPREELYGFRHDFSPRPTKWYQPEWNDSEDDLRFGSKLEEYEGIRNLPENGYEKSVELGLGDAMWELAMLYETGDHGFPKDVDRAIRLYEQAAGHGYVFAQVLPAKIQEIAQRREMEGDG